MSEYKFSPLHVSAAFKQVQKWTDPHGKRNGTTEKPAPNYYRHPQVVVHNSPSLDRKAGPSEAGRQARLKAREAWRLIRADVRTRARI